jgi:hypothetical protein
LRPATRYWERASDSYLGLLSPSGFDFGAVVFSSFAVKKTPSLTALKALTRESP